MVSRCDRQFVIGEGELVGAVLGLKRRCVVEVDHRGREEPVVERCDVRIAHFPGGHAASMRPAAPLETRDAAGFLCLSQRGLDISQADRLPFVLTHLKEVALEAVMKIPELLTGEQVATRLGISRERVRQLAGRPDFPPPLGRIGKAIVWSEDDVDAYANGVRRFFIVNGISIGTERARELAARLEREAGPGGTEKRNRARALASAVSSQLEVGGGMNISDKEAATVFDVLQKWLDDVGVDAFGEQLMDLRYRLYADLDDAGAFRKGGEGHA
jgi:hypothetical protein